MPMNKLTLTAPSDVIALAEKQAKREKSSIFRKGVPPKKMKEKLRAFRNIVTPLDVTQSIIGKAIDSELTDFEDAVQFYTAVYSDADFIITRNGKHFPVNDGPTVLTAYSGRKAKCL